jgi:hypothetical protein
MSSKYSSHHAVKSIIQNLSEWLYFEITHCKIYKSPFSCRVFGSTRFTTDQSVGRYTPVQLMTWTADCKSRSPANVRIKHQRAAEGVWRTKQQMAIRWHYPPSVPSEDYPSDWDHDESETKYCCCGCHCRAYRWRSGLQFSHQSLVDIAVSWWPDFLNKLNVKLFPPW